MCPRPLLRLAFKLLALLSAWVTHDCRSLYLFENPNLGGNLLNSVTTFTNLVYVLCSG